MSKYKVLSELSIGTDAKVISSNLDVPYATVLRYKREFEQAKLDGNVDTILGLGPGILEELAEAAKPEEVLLANEVEAVTSSIKALDRLSAELQSTASYMNTKLKSLAMSASDARELSILIDSLCALQSSFFNKNQVNIQNNFGDQNGGASKYSKFLSDVPADN